jgi:membrane protease YdiL (CAAX protease family)
MTTPVRLVREHPMLSFAVLACLFGWSNYIAAAFGVGSDPGNQPVGPVVAALVVVACQGRGSLSGWWRQLRGWRASPGWYALAFLVPLAVHVINVLINHALGAPLPTMAQLGHWPDLLPTFVVMLVLVGIGEEGGWTAFAAPLLLRRHGLFGAWAILSGLRILWHLPLMVSGEMSWVMGFVGNAAFQLILLQIFSASGGRWSLAAVWHTTLNTFGGSFFFTMVSGADNTRLGLLLSGAYALLATVVLIRRRGETSAEELGDLGHGGLGLGGHHAGHAEERVSRTGVLGERNGRAGRA